MTLKFQGTLCIVLMLLACACGKKQDQRFRLLDPSETGIRFENTIRENDTVNVFTFMNIYTGAGVAVGDINNDGLTDLYFSGNMVSGRLYLNKGGLQFEDISEAAGILNSRWGTGASMVDINQDGWLDIYVCVSGGGAEAERANLLYINNGDLTFTESAAAYGLADTRQSMQAAFFDYDKDQDLDMYLLVNPAAYEYKVNISTPKQLDGKSVSNDRLYRNEGNGKFTDVTLEAGILVEGYGLGVGIADINDDSWPDIYVSNDFIGNDILYINQGDGTFRDEITGYINHSSYAGMGNDVADIDNNGKPDIMVLDMRPEDNERQKLIIASTGYDRFQMMLEAGYDPQYSRNTLQLNQGGGEFSEIGFLAGVSSTDWSWSALLADYDNDGHKDMYVTNGFLRDLGNLDYIHYQNIYDNPLGDPQTKINNKLNSIKELPSAKLLNYAFKNKGDATFEDVSRAWGITEASCSNGAAYADLDNDGDLDIVVNNVNQPAFLHENLSNQQPGANYLRISLEGQPGNRQGIGSKIKLTSGSEIQSYQHFLSRGYESSVDPTIHFGLGGQDSLEQLEIWWPDNRYQVLTGVPANQWLHLRQEDAGPPPAEEPPPAGATWFRELTDSLGVDFEHREDPMVDFKLQPILPHMHSRNGPGIAVADANGDGLEDFYVGGASGQYGRLYLQGRDGGFIGQTITAEGDREDMGALFFDADQDGDQDLYVVSGGVLAVQDQKEYQDRLYLNDGQGHFTISGALPPSNISGSVVTASDFDRDGDLDLFVGGRVNPGKYPMPVASLLLENQSDGDPGQLKFRNIGRQIAHWDRLTMVTSALWTDYDNDGWTDLIVCGEFMPVTFYKNVQGQLVYASEQTGLSATEGWWNSIAAGDFDNDGDTDYLLGNLGLNGKYKASQEEPLCIYAKDFDKDGRIDPVMCHYMEGENFLAHSRDEIISQISAMRARFRTYESYAKTTFEDSFLPEELEDAYVVKSHTFVSSYMENLGNGKFAMHPLPLAVQLGPIEGMAVEDLDSDGNLDVVLTGNAYGTEVATGRYDAIKGIFLKGGGNGTFSVVPLEESGFRNDSDGSGLALLRDKEGATSIIVANSDGPVRVFGHQQKPGGKTVYFAEEEATSAQLLFTDGRVQKIEFFRGSGYLSQSTRSILIHEGIQRITITDVDGNTKTVFEK